MKATRSLRFAREAAIVAVATVVALASTIPAYAAKVPAGAAPLAFGTLYARGVTSPFGQLWLGSHLWVDDHAAGFCRLDPAAAPAPAGTFAENPATCDATSASGGQPAFDPATNMVYIPDVSVRSPGAVRLGFSPTSETVGDAAVLSPAQGLAMIRTTATAVSPDGTLYVGAKLSGNIFRVKDPTSAAPTLEVAGKTSDGRGVTGLAFAGSDLYIAEGGGVTLMANAASCAGSCTATATAITAAAPSAIVSDGANVLFIADTPFKRSSIIRYTISTNTQVLYATSGGTVNPLGKIVGRTPFLNVSGLGLDPAGNLYVGHDPSAGGGIGVGSIWLVKRVP